MKKVNYKALLYLGAALLTLGVVFKIFTELSTVSIILIVAGALLKITSVQIRISKGYKPGIEFIFLISGLALFLPGVYIEGINQYFNPLFIMVPGIILKSLFIILFIKKLRK